MSLERIRNGYGRCKRTASAGWRACARAVRATGTFAIENRGTKAFMWCVERSAEGQIASHDFHANLGKPLYAALGRGARACGWLAVTVADSKHQRPPIG